MLSKTEIERLAELAHVGAVRAADAFAQLVGRPIATADPIVVNRERISDDQCAVPTFDSDSTGVFFEFDGCLDAIVGILFEGDASEMLVRRIVGVETGVLPPTIIESALMEVGNILASHVASAIADQLESRLLPSIPSLAMSDAEAEFEIFIERAIGGECERIESQLSDESGALTGRLVLVPTS